MPGFAARYDVEDVLEVAEQCRFLLIAAEADKWSRGARDIKGRLSAASTGRVRVGHVAGGHRFSPQHRRLAYEFLSEGG